jgi:O-antigen/teichoic acid export membrane protein
MAVGFFLAPFLVHRLGAVEYGVWILVMSSINYLAMLDLGMRSSVIRFVSKTYSVADHQGSSEAMSAALWVRAQFGGVSLLVSVVLAVVFPYLFRVPPELAFAARVTVILMGVNMAISLSMGAIGGVLSALNRYDLQTGASLIQLALRVVGIVYFVSHGRGLVAIAICELAASIIGNLLTVYFTHRQYPEIRVLWKRPERSMLRSLWSYGFYAFLTTVALQLIYQSDNLVVGSFVSAGAVTLYSIGNSLCRYADQLLTSMSLTFVPAASAYEATGKLSSLQNLYTNGTRVTLAIALPIITTFLIRGDQFIGLWMGPMYAHSSGEVLLLLAIPLPFVYANRTAVSIAFGTERHKKPALLFAAEGVANLALSIFLVRRFGIIGVAIGTVIPSLISQLIIFPRLLPELVNVRPSLAVLKYWAPMFLAIVPFAAGSWILRSFAPGNIVVFFLQTAAILPLFLIALMVIFRRKFVDDILPLVYSFGKRLRNQAS